MKKFLIIGLTLLVALDLGGGAAPPATAPRAAPAVTDPADDLLNIMTLEEVSGLPDLDLKNVSYAVGDINATTNVSVYGSFYNETSISRIIALMFTPAAWEDSPAANATIVMHAQGLDDDMNNMTVVAVLNYTQYISPESLMGDGDGEMVFADSWHIADNATLTLEFDKAYFPAEVGDVWAIYAYNITEEGENPLADFLPSYCAARGLTSSLFGDFMPVSLDFLCLPYGDVAVDVSAFPADEITDVTLSNGTDSFSVAAPNLGDLFYFNNLQHGVYTLSYERNGEEVEFGTINHTSYVTYVVLGAPGENVPVPVAWWVWALAVGVPTLTLGLLGFTWGRPGDTYCAAATAGQKASWVARSRCSHKRVIPL